MGTIQQEGQKLWDSQARKLSGDGFLISYLNGASFKEVLTTLDINRKQYLMLILIKDDLRGL